MENRFYLVKLNSKYSFLYPKHILSLKHRSTRPYSDISALNSVVRTAWAETLALAPFDPNQSWAEAGADSLASLQLLLRLERVVGRKLPFDLLDPDMTPAELACALAAPVPGLGEPHAGEADSSGLFIIPGLYGDEPKLADFRRRLLPGLRLEVVDYPGMHETASVIGQMTELGRYAATQISRRQPSGPIRLAGYSFGGGVAFAAASQLITMGRVVCFLGVLDAPFTMNAWAGLARRGLRGWAEALLLRACDWDAGRLLAIAVVQRLRPGMRERLRRSLVRRFRVRAIRSWHPQPIDSATTRLVLVTSRQFGPANTAQWKWLCPGACIIETPGNHAELLDPSVLWQWTQAFAEAAQAASCL